MSFKIKRIYAAASTDDGYRVLVDRLWPRGVSKERAALDEWMKDAAPSPELREWFDHRAERFDEFTTRYELELQANPAVAELHSLAKRHQTITLLYAAHDQEVNHAVVLLRFLHQA